jgi:acyl carrier protein
MTDLAILRETRAYVVENFLYMRTDFIPGDDDSLLGQGVIDSMGVVELVVFVEKEFGITVDEEEINEDHFGTLGAISRYVANKLPSIAPSSEFTFASAG